MPIWGHRACLLNCHYKWGIKTTCKRFRLIGGIFWWLLSKNLNRVTSQNQRSPDYSRPTRKVLSFPLHSFGTCVFGIRINNIFEMVSSLYLALYTVWSLCDAFTMVSIVLSVPKRLKRVVSSVCNHATISDKVRYILPPNVLFVEYAGFSILSIPLCDFRFSLQRFCSS